MRIGFDARMVYGNFSGIGHYSLNLLLSLAQLDKNSHYFVIVRDDFNYSLPDNFTLVRYDHYPLSFTTLYLMKHRIKSYRIDVFHSPFGICPLNLEYATMITVHDLMPLLLPNFFEGRNKAVQFYARQFTRFAMLKSLGKSTSVVSDSHTTKSDILRFNIKIEKKIRVIYPSISLPNTELSKEFESNSTKSDDHPLILSVGHTRPQKNWLRLMKAFKILRDKGIKATMCLTSSDDRNLGRIRELVRELRLEPETVRILGYVSQSELHNLYVTADLFVFPSLYEGFGLPPLEAMACRVPVVASNRGSLSEVLGEAAFYVNPEDEHDIARGMLEMLKNKGLRQAMVAKGCQQVAKYSWEASAKQILELYDELSRG